MRLKKSMGGRRRDRPGGNDPPSKPENGAPGQFRRRKAIRKALPARHHGLPPPPTPTGQLVVAAAVVSLPPNPVSTRVPTGSRPFSFHLREVSRKTFRPHPRTRS